MFVKRKTIEKLMLIALCSILTDKCTINKIKMEEIKIEDDKAAKRSKERK